MNWIFKADNNPKIIIYEEAIKEFKNHKIRSSSYSALFNSIVRAINSDMDNIKENKLETEAEILHLELNDFEKFVGLRMSVYACFLAIVAFATLNTELQAKFGFLHFEYWISGFCIAGIFIVTTLNITSRRQKRRMTYLKFKMQCFEKILHNKE